MMQYLEMTLTLLTLILPIVFTRAVFTHRCRNKQWGFHWHYETWVIGLIGVFPDNCIIPASKFGKV